MWDNKTFIQFLKENGAGDKWHSLIYPTMKKCLISMKSVPELNCILFVGSVLIMVILNKHDFETRRKLH